MPGEQVTPRYLERHGFNYPIMVTDMEGLGLKLPPPTFSVLDVERYVGKEGGGRWCHGPVSDPFAAPAQVRRFSSHTPSGCVCGWLRASPGPGAPLRGPSRPSPPVPQGLRPQRRSGRVGLGRGGVGW